MNWRDGLIAGSCRQLLPQPRAEAWERNNCNWGKLIRREWPNNNVTYIAMAKMHIDRPPDVLRHRLNNAPRHQSFSDSYMTPRRGVCLHQRHRDSYCAMKARAHQNRALIILSASTDKMDNTANKSRRRKRQASSCLQFHIVYSHTLVPCALTLYSCICYWTAWDLYECEFDIRINCLTI